MNRMLLVIGLMFFYSSTLLAETPTPEQMEKVRQCWVKEVWTQPKKICGCDGNKDLCTCGQDCTCPKCEKKVEVAAKPENLWWDNGRWVRESEFFKKNNYQRTQSGRVESKGPIQGQPVMIREGVPQQRQRFQNPAPDCRGGS